MLPSDFAGRSPAAANMLGYRGAGYIPTDNEMQRMKNELQHRINELVDVNIHGKEGVAKNLKEVRRLKKKWDKYIYRYKQVQQDRKNEAVHLESLLLEIGHYDYLDK